jgi:protein gp37
MISAPNYEAAGADAALECLDAISNSLSGCDEVSKGARRGAATILANALERGLKAIRQDGK